MIERILKEIQDIHSVSVKEGKLLSRLARECKGRGVIVEIGSWKGYSTICLAKGSKEGEGYYIYAIDPHTGSTVHKERYGEVNTLPVFQKNINDAGVGDIVIPVVMTSKEAVKGWDRPIELLWIDGDHEAADKDFDWWFPHVVGGGIIAMHDTTAWTSGLPYRVAMSRIYKSGEFTDIHRVGSITYATKSNLLSVNDQVANKWCLYRRYLYQVLLPSYNKVLLLGAKVLGRA